MQALGEEAKRVRRIGPNLPSLTHQDRAERWDEPTSSGGRGAPASRSLYQVSDRRHSIIQRMRRTVATHITLLNFTEQGIRNVQASPERFEAFRSMVAQLGVTVKSVY